MIFSIIFSILFEVVFWSIFIGVFVKAFKRSKLQRRNFSKELKQNKTFENEDDLKDLIKEERYVPKYYYTYCDFCGAKVSKGDKNCPECKAKLKK